MPSLKRKDTRKVIDQSSISQRSSHEVNVVRSDGNDFDFSCFSLSITPSGCHSDASKWVLDTGSTYHIVPEGSWLLALRSWMVIRCPWETITHASWLVRVQFVSGYIMGY